MHSNNSNESIAKDIETIISEHEALRRKHNKLARSTASGFKSTAELGEELHEEIQKKDKRIFWLTVSQIAVLCYLIFIL